MGSDINTIEQRLKSFTVQLQTECGILERLVYKHKNQHRRCSYFQYILKVRRDLKLLKLANVEEIFEASFIVINGSRPKQKVQLLESLKRRKCQRGKYNFLERLLGATRLLSQMVEPMLKAATEISTLLARSFFMKFSLTILAVLARLRVLVQQMLLDGVHLYNTVSALSRKEHAVKLNQEGFEVFREYYPRKEEASVILECIWQTDKYVLVERTDKCESIEKDDQQDISLKTSNILYENIEVLLGVEEPEIMEAEHVSADATPNNSAPIGGDSGKHIQDVLETATAASANVLSPENVCTDPNVENVSEANGKDLVETGSRTVEILDRQSVSVEAALPSKSMASSVPSPAKLKNAKEKKVAFISVKPPTPPIPDQSRFHLKGTDEKNKGDEDPFFSLLTGVNSKFNNMF